MKLFLILLFIIFTLIGCKNDSIKQAQLLASKASILSVEGKHTDAIPLLEEASRLRPMCVEYHVGIAIESVKTENYTMAQDRYKKALAILQEQSKEDPERIDDLIIVLICLNRDEDAANVLNEAKSRFKENTTIAMLSNNYTEIVSNLREWRIKK